MTARERIKAYQAETGCCFADALYDGFEDEMVALVQAAIAEEREACASLADLNSITDETASSACHTIAAAIRARSTT